MFACKKGVQPYCRSCSAATSSGNGALGELLGITQCRFTHKIGQMLLNTAKLIASGNLQTSSLLRGTFSLPKRYLTS